MNRILFATDGSDSAKAASRYVKSLLDAFAECKLVVLTVKQPMPMVEGFGFPGEPVIDLSNEPSEAIKESVEEDFAQYRDRMNFVSVTGHPAVTICEEAETQQADLIIVGSHGRSAVDRLLLGSVSNGVVHRSKIPVLVVK